MATRDVALPPQTQQMPLVLYGAGTLGKMAKDYLRHVGMPFRYVVDANPAPFSNDPAWDGIEVVAPSDVPALDKSGSLLAVCISTVPYAPLYQSLRAQGWKHVVPFYDMAESFRDRHPLSNGWFSGRFDDHDMAGIEQVLRRWDDDVSRAHHLQFLAWRCLREEWTFDGAPVTTGDRYFIPEVRALLHDNESFLDLGAHHGEVSIGFSEMMGGEFGRIMAIEPDTTNLSLLRQNFTKFFPEARLNRVTTDDSVIAEQCGCGLFVEGLDYASQLSPMGRRNRVVRSIDSMVLTPTFIKLHLEGGELAALNGGAATLRKCRPIIAATVYHNRLGLWEVPLWLAHSLPDYRILLRLHGWCGTGLVVYALPNERKGRVQPK